ncbi:hypothetical protein J2792_001481 [Novosphingobium capsulatum]|uniref:Uncharacterized protein n=1 Tax=Novosphingobium capsulatum TaxID=13688 RepID=A0ABU1MJT7_9SPHN|nr:hypothetical protein [Novosphingobium capsulatum]MDR6510615.1 hypothetical protein [Novosphingobium capsulatum]
MAFDQHRKGCLATLAHASHQRHVVAQGQAPPIAGRLRLGNRQRSGRKRPGSAMSMIDDWSSRMKTARIFDRGKGLALQVTAKGHAVHPSRTMVAPSIPLSHSPAGGFCLNGKFTVTEIV